MGFNATITDNRTKAFWEKVCKTSTCWFWTCGFYERKGYGQFWVGKRNIAAHRYSWQLTHGNVPVDRCILHKCGNASCVNPDHLYLSEKDYNKHDCTEYNNDNSLEAILTKDFIDKFWSKVHKTTSCWLWTGGTWGSKMKYGRIWDRYRVLNAHHVSWMIHHREVPTGMFVLHHCDVPLCVNPAHLFLGTAADNMHDCIAKGRVYGGDKHWSHQYPGMIRRGEKHHNAKLTDDDVREIFKMSKEGRLQQDIAECFNVSEKNISLIVTRKTWKHVQEVVL